MRGLTQADMTPERQAGLLALYNGGMTQRAIAKKIGSSATTIGIILRSIPGYEKRSNHGGGKPVTGHSEKTIELARRVGWMVSEGIDKRWIMTNLGKTRSRVNQLNRLSKKLS